MQPFPLSEARPPEHTAALPVAADVVVIGGGVIGVTAALFLARAGVSVVLVEKGRVAAEQSSRNWGWIRVQGRDPAEIPVALEAQRLWPELAPALDADIGLTRGGVVYLAGDENEVAAYESWMRHAAAFEISTRLLDADGAARLLPDAARRWAGALWTPTDMRAEPLVAVPALARLAAQAGAVIREHCAARRLDLEAGRVTGVATEAGRIRAGAVVLAGGAWSALFLRCHGLSIPQLSVRATVLRTAPMAEIFQGGAVDDRIAWRRRQDGGYALAREGRHDLYLGPDALRAFAHYLPQYLKSPMRTALRPAAPRGFPDAWGTKRRWRADQESPFERMRVLNPAPNRPKTNMVARHFAETFPVLGTVEIAQRWAGMIDLMPDTVPVVDRVAQLPGLIVATGMSGHGFGIGPAFGRIVADLAQGNSPGHDLARFRMSRFFDGTRLDAGPQL